MPTAEDFLDLLPQFSGVEPVTIEAWLAEAARVVGTEYGADQDRATIFLAAHKMSLSGLGPEAGAGGLLGVKSVSSGSLSVTKDDSKMGDYGLTSFGREFYPIWRSVRGGSFMVTGTGTLPEPNFPGFLHGHA